jgi:DNA-binding Lrp family transcriptional regulator
MSSNQSDKRQKDSDWGAWALIVLLFAFGIWPVALPLLLIKLFAPDKRREGTVQTQIPYRSGEQTADHRARAAAHKMTRSPSTNKSSALVLKIIGILLACVGVYLASGPAGLMIAGQVAGNLWDLLKGLALAVGGLGMLIRGVVMDRAIRRYPRYLAVMGDEASISFSELSRKLGYSRRQVIRDLQKMIDRGFFGGCAYLNMELGFFFRDRQASADFEKQQEAQRPPKEAEEGYSGILRSIRRTNDEIADPVLSRKIDRLEEITAKIFRTVEAEPEKRGRINTFMDYYLPTTQKLLESYAKFEATGIESGNLQQAKEHINKTMDAIIAGFEHQLDELYRSDTMDVDSDIRVMETMLRRDTASVEQDFGLGSSTQNASGAADSLSEEDLGGMAAQKREKTEQD